jgi:hypothetical protein
MPRCDRVCREDDRTGPLGNGRWRCLGREGACRYPADPNKAWHDPAREGERTGRRRVAHDAQIIPPAHRPGCSLSRRRLTPPVARPGSDAQALAYRGPPSPPDPLNQPRSVHVPAPRSCRRAIVRVPAAVYRRRGPSPEPSLASSICSLDRLIVSSSRPISHDAGPPLHDDAWCQTRQRARPKAGDRDRRLDKILPLLRTPSWRPQHPPSILLARTFALRLPAMITPRSRCRERCTTRATLRSAAAVRSRILNTQVGARRDHRLISSPGVPRSSCKQRNALSTVPSTSESICFGCTMRDFPAHHERLVHPLRSYPTFSDSQIGAPGALSAC